MVYTKDSEITNLTDVVEFFEHLLYEKKLSYHPDDDFKDYLNINKNNTPYFKPEEVDIYNKLMDQCFEICKKQSVDIYSIGLSTMRRVINPDIQDPLEIGMLARVRGEKDIFRIIQKMNGKYRLSSTEKKTCILIDESEVIPI